MLKDWGLGSVWLKTLVIGHIKLASGNCKHANFRRYRNFEKIVEDIDLSSSLSDWGFESSVLTDGDRAG